MANQSVISVETTDSVVLITIERPRVRNALNREVLTELSRVVASLESSDSARAVILTGTGAKSFVAGADIKEMMDLSVSEATLFAELGAGVMASIEASRKPYLAAVNGFALGGGCELALACDCIYASETATFGQPEVKLGVIPGFGGTQRLARRVGIGRALDLIMTGRMIGAPQAYEIGLVDRLFPAARLLDEVREVAAQIARNGSLAVSEAKRVVRAGQAGFSHAGLALEQRSFGGLFSTEEQQNRMSAFVAKGKH